MSLVSSRLRARNTRQLDLFDWASSRKNWPILCPSPISRKYTAEWKTTPELTKAILIANGFEVDFFNA